jgi:hypothetical protein
VAVQDALAVAFTRCVLVASAGNDAYINERTLGTKLQIVPNYPAALTYVLGVMSVGKNGVESGFTNVDGKPYTGYEYEAICDTPLAKRADVLVVGPYREELRCEGKMYGSSNQRIIRR